LHFALSFCWWSYQQIKRRGVPTFAKAHFGHPSPSSRQKLNGTDYIICDALKILET
jgi:hypothetical protein